MKTIICIIFILYQIKIDKDSCVVSEEVVLSAEATGGIGNLSYKFYYEKDSECYFSFGPDCTNIINALIECGVIESEEQIRWHY